jgi:hypothetical protein
MRAMKMIKKIRKKCLMTRRRRGEQQGHDEMAIYSPIRIQWKAEYHS